MHTLNDVVDLDSFMDSPIIAFQSDWGLDIFILFFFSHSDVDLLWCGSSFEVEFEPSLSCWAG